MTRRSLVSAFTIIETLVACAVVGVALSALAAASVAMQRSLFSVRGHSSALGSQTRIADYVRRDLRNALDVLVMNGGARLRIELPADYDDQGNPIDPTVGSGRTVVYGIAGARLQADYYLDVGNFVREVSGTKTVVAAGVADFRPSFTPIQAAGKLVAIRLDLTYAGHFGSNAAADADGRQATRLSTEMALRNKPVPLPPTVVPQPTGPRAKRKGR